ncbi:MAG: DUF4365 domain-containing protein [Tannerellaceae bacterium]|jgi:hypothetical protein|nr:DUF4365 domain-containing protein [Tannerellaceae bacterium]
METLPLFTSDNWQEQIGVHKVGLMLTELGLIFRTTSNSDVGIDGQIEYVNNKGEVTGKIAAVQIKSGDSYLYESKSDSENFTFYPDEKHKYYWEKFPIPVILFVHSPSRNKVYFVDARHYFRINGIGNIKIPKENTLDKTTKNKVFETIGNFDEPFLEIKDVFDAIVQNHFTSPLFNLSYLDLNLAEIDLGDFLIDWNKNGMVSRFLVTLTRRRNSLLRYIDDIEKNNPDIMPETYLVQERFIQMRFDFYSSMRIEKAQKLQELIREKKI